MLSHAGPLCFSGRPRITTRAVQPPTIPAFVALGGNVGDVAATFRSALVRLAAAPGIGVRRVSSLYRTAPVGPIAQDDFRNAVVELAVTIPPLDLLAVLLDTERALGRDRSREQRWGPRTLDLDLLVYGDVELRTDTLTVPHPRLTDRLFVLAPLAEIAPDLAVAGATMREWRDRRTLEQGAGVVPVANDWANGLA